MDRCTFWMVYGLHQSAPTVRHKSEDSALNEAERLARLHPSTTFFVLEATHRVGKRDVLVEALGARCYAPSREDDDGIPF